MQNLEDVMDAAMLRGLSQGRIEGEDRGRAQGRAQGYNDGQIEGMRAGLLRIVHVRFGSISADLEHCIATADTTTVELLTTQALVADSLSDLDEQALAIPDRLMTIINASLRAGRTEGKARGRAEGRRESLRTIVRVRFGSIPADLEHLIAADETTLETLITQCLQIARLTELEST